MADLTTVSPAFAFTKPSDSSFPAVSQLRSPLAAGSRYADSAPLLAKVQATYALLGDVAAEERVSGLGPPQALSEDTVTRRWLDDFLARKRGVLPALSSATEPFMRATTATVARAWPGGAEIVADRASSKENALWDRAHSVLFDDVLNPDHNDIELVPAGAEEITCIQEAAALVAEVAPDLFTAVMPHTSLVWLVTGADAFESASDRRLPRAVYLSRHACTDVVRTAEALLHESVHQKLYDLQLIYTLYASTYDPRTAPTVQPSWHPPGTGWSIDRTVAATHVYVHLTAFLERLQDAVPAGYSGATIARTAQQARARADMLIGGLAPYVDSQLNHHGQAFVSWLQTTHHNSGVSPPEVDHD